MLCYGAPRRAKHQRACRIVASPPRASHVVTCRYAWRGSYFEDTLDLLPEAWVALLGAHTVGAAAVVGAATADFDQTPLRFDNEYFRALALFDSSGKVHLPHTLNPTPHTHTRARARARTHAHTPATQHHARPTPSPSPREPMPRPPAGAARP